MPLIMAESIKFNDNKFVDATDVWDSTLNKTQRETNNLLNSKVAIYTLTLTYYSADQLRGQFTIPPIPQGYTNRNVLYGTYVPYTNIGNKLSGKFMLNGNVLIAIGSGFATTESITVPVIVVFS